MIVLEVAPDPQAPIVTRALAAIAAENPPARACALAARTAIRRGEWTTAVTAAERARAASPGDPRAVDALHAHVDALLRLGRRAEAYRGGAPRAVSGRHERRDGWRAGGDGGAALRARGLGDRRLDGRSLNDRAALPLDERTAALWPVIFVAGLDAALRALARPGRRAGGAGPERPHDSALPEAGRRRSRGLAR